MDQLCFSVQTDEWCIHNRLLNTNFGDKFNLNEHPKKEIIFFLEINELWPQVQIFHNFSISMLSINNIVRSIEFVIRVGAGTVNACLVLNYRDKRHI
jgi:hypothetical protein